MSISLRLKSKRLELGLTQHQLAILCGVKQQTIQRIEAGTSHRPRHLLEISQALGCSPHWLLNGVGEQVSGPDHEV
ncbi:helix-turn-helix domain-containing protein [Pantoea ananatis]|uniref:helix-turn-helix domain-containing protein n=1 Tax=Pantoea ananas TaxID=553 RepID=UPI001B30340F|nr:helix-turn-helix transcriptional regulator [Pantoea ananatis]